MRSKAVAPYYFERISYTRPTSPVSRRTLIPWGWVGDLVRMSCTTPRVSCPAWHPFPALPHHGGAEEEIFAHMGWRTWRDGSVVVALLSCRYRVIDELRLALMAMAGM